MADYQSYKKIQGDQALVANSVGPGQVVGLSTGIVCRSFYYNCCNNCPCNGGCCYLWTVPSGVTSIQFEIISGGGSGAPSRCCNNSSGIGGGGGGYATKMQYANCGHFTPGATQFTICAGSSSRCSENGCCNGRTGCGYAGCPSFVLGGGLGTFCMKGGSFAGLKWDDNCYSCVRVCQSNNCFGSNVDAQAANWPDGQTQPSSANPENEFKMCGHSGGELRHYNCHSGAWAIAGAPPGPWTPQRNFGINRCAVGNIRGCCNNSSMWPGGGGYGGTTQGGQCWGDWGNGGLVVVTTWS